MTRGFKSGLVLCVLGVGVLLWMRLPQRVPPEMGPSDLDTQVREITTASSGPSMGSGWREMPSSEGSIGDAAAEEMSALNVSDAASMASEQTRVPEGLAGQAAPDEREARVLSALATALNEGRYQDVLRLYEEVSWRDLRAKAASLKAEAILALSRQTDDKLPFADRLAHLDEQLAQMPEQVALYQAKSEMLFEQGFIDDALAALASGEAWMQGAEDLAALDRIRADLQRQHLEFLVKNQLWAETVAFVDRTTLMEDPDVYVASQKALAQANAGLFNWDEASIFLENASLAAPEDLDVESLRQKIQHSQSRQREQESVPENRWVEIPVRTLGNALVVTATLQNNRTVDLLLDTGASITAIDAGYFDSMGGQTLSDSGLARTFLSASGRFEAPVRVLNQLSVGPLNAQNLEVALIEQPSSAYQGLLGMNFLKFFEMSIDMEQHLLRLRMR